MRVSTNGVALDVATDGPQEGPMVLMLHGFPECAHGWHRQVKPLVDRGFFVVRPDQRGYAGSDKPGPLREYALDRLVGDALGLLDAFGRKTAHVVGHDWGGAVAWGLAIDHADRVDRLCIMNMPHPRVLARRILVPPQLLRSWYALFFQLPRLPERVLSAYDYARLARVLRKSSLRDVFTPEDFEAYRRCWRQPGALRGMLAWYRASMRHPRLPSRALVTAPTLLVWGRHDPALGIELVEPSARRCLQARVEILEEAGHFVQHDAAERVNALLAEFLPSP